MEELLAIILLGFGTALGCLVLWKVYHIVKSSIDKDKNTIAITEEDFDRMARAFIEHKKEMSHRLKNIEASLGEDSHNAMQIESPKERSNSQKIDNELNQKQRVP